MTYIMLKGRKNTKLLIMIISIMIMIICNHHQCDSGGRKTQSVELRNGIPSVPGSRPDTAVHLSHPVTIIITSSSYLCINELTLSVLWTKTDTFANSVDPDETAHYEPSHLDLHCLPFWFWITTVTLLAANGCVQMQRWKSLFQEHRVERVNISFLLL